MVSELRVPTGNKARNVPSWILETGGAAADLEEDSMSVADDDESKLRDSWCLMPNA